MDHRADAPGRLKIIAGEHHHLDSQILKLTDGGPGFRFDGIGYGNQSQWACIVCHQYDGFPLGLQPIDGRGHFFVTRP